MIALIDYDSLIYKSVYRIVSFTQLRVWVNENKGREWIESEIVNLSVNRLCNMGDALMTAIEDDDIFKENGFEIEFCEYFITPKSSFRKQINPTYKANRTYTSMFKWVSKVRKYLLAGGFAKIKEGFEADDLVADRARELKNECIIISMDKDMNQLPGIHFNFYRKPSKEYDQFGHKIENPYKGISIVTETEAEYNLWYQMLVGDTSDNVKGVKGIGAVRAKKILAVEDMEAAVKESYQNVYDDWETEYNINYQMLYLGTDRDIVELLNLKK